MTPLSGTGVGPVAVIEAQGVGGDEFAPVLEYENANSFSPDKSDSDRVDRLRSDRLPQSDVALLDEQRTAGVLEDADPVVGEDSNSGAPNRRDFSDLEVGGAGVTTPRPVSSALPNQDEAGGEKPNGLLLSKQDELLRRASRDENSRPSRDAGSGSSRDGNLRSSRDEKKHLTRDKKTGKSLKTENVLVFNPPSPPRSDARSPNQDEGRPHTSNQDESVSVPVGKSDGTRPSLSRTIPSLNDLTRLKSLLPSLSDGGRWTVENEGYAWKIRRVWDKNGTTQSARYLRLRWATWHRMKDLNYDDTRIANMLADKIGRKQRELDRNRGIRLA